MRTAMVRAPAVAGMFYPAEPAALRAQVDAYLAAGHVSDEAGAPKVLIVPHAGYLYSGSVAASAYRLLQPIASRIRRVVMIGPAHRVWLRGLALPGVDAFDTPLGRVAVDRAACAALADLPQVSVQRAAHAQEHSLEVQLPFLQTVLPAFEIVPLVAGSATGEEVAEVLDRLWGGDETLILISSDLSHYLDYAQGRAVDRRTVDRVLAMQADLDGDQACGATGINGALLCAARRGLQPALLDLCNSGDTSGGRDRVVGYCAISFGDPAAGASPGPALLAIAREAIAARLGLSAPPPAPGAQQARALREIGATFVTLTLDGALRGCIGSLDAHRPLGEDVRANAVAAAFRDPRFAPLSTREFARVRIEVSLLTAPELLTADGEQQARAALRPHEDGLILQWRDHRATFLPQVWENLPRPAEFLRQLKRKAGLADDFWADDLVLHRYTVRKWSEAGLS